MKVGFIGAGNMASAIINGMRSKDIYEISVTDINDLALSKFKGKVEFVSDSAREVIKRSEYVVLAIKPYQYQDFLIEHQELLKDKVVISIAAGISNEFMTKYTNDYLLVMPNTPSALGLGLTSIIENEKLDQEIFNKVVELFKSIGEVEIIKESDLETLICLAGSAPAFFYLVIDAMAKYGELHGIEKEKATRIAANVMSASAQMVLRQDEDSRTLADRVCSPNGSTIRAVEYFDNNGLDQIFSGAMDACYHRAKEMKKENDECL